MSSISTSIPPNLNEAQLEILQLFAGGLSETQLQELRRILLDFKFRRITELADQYVDNKGWSDQDISKDAQNLNRRPYKSKNN